MKIGFAGCPNRRPLKDSNQENSMAHPLAGQPAPPASLADIPALFAAYQRDLPDLADPAQRVAKGFRFRFPK